MGWTTEESWLNYLQRQGMQTRSANLHSASLKMILGRGGAFFGTESARV